ncbi:flagellar basal-body MS-ring/collar protein FliF [Thermaerobacillus caldiproteolyticus]|uniref:flagellar basal-body MS-ring/collar protein FliF n=1 Tax=Thermaerobacillus caldiproteolyticus TaxID=247480 RepID=UPI00188A4B81|nr:flagellar basal-body MS-ring/collar protein FliF [Anoxybacillus caldiproteolyticus]QPA32047.1 flagellar M-ring protein FliF [Anoxybacillus caldiproteolyticus]
MNDRLKDWIHRFTSFWKGRTKKQKIIAISGILLFLLLVAVTSFWATRPNFVPLYSNLTPQETGQIKATLDQRGVESQVTDNGTTIKVPEKMADTLKVELAAEGIPNSGSIDYSFFGKNASFGMTDNEFNVVKLEAMQTELANLIKSIDGVEDAKVMISLPQQSVFVSDDQGEASASVVLKTKPGYQFSDEQIKALYHLVSKSVPNLPTDNIVIMNQYFEYFDLKNNDKNLSTGTAFATQQEVKKQIERDIQRQVQQMLGTMMGQDKVVVSVTADVDFTQENREENLVTPVDEQNKQGIAVSVQRIKETYSGKGAQPGGVAGTGENEVPSYQTTTGDTNGDYERTEETINNEVNRIKKHIVESPYKVRDLGIQVMVEPPNPKDPNSLPQQTVDDIQKILGTIVRTSISKDNGQQLTDADIQNRIVVSVQPFNGKMKFTEPKSAIPTWAYIAGGIVAAILIGLIVFFLWRKRKQDDEEELDELIEQPVVPEIPDIHQERETESTLRRKQLEKLAKEKPDEFAKLLRAWLAED